jgi:hypothetical protein
MYARVTTYPSTSLRHARQQCQASTIGAIPALTAQRGCRGTLVLSDPMTGRVQTLSFWDSDDTLIASNGPHRRESERIARAAGLSGAGAVTRIFDVVGGDVAMVRGLDPTTTGSRPAASAERS